MIEIEARIRNAATDKTLREAARVIWAREAVKLFEDQPRNGIRISDAGQCVRSLWNEIHVAPKVFAPEVQIDNLDDGSMRGLWRACLLKASLEADGYYVELEPTVEHDGTPGHIDLYFEGDSLIGTMALNYPVPKRLGCVVEFKATNQAFHVKGPHEPNKDGSTKWYQIVQLMKYCAAKGVEDGAIVTISPSFRDAPMRADWFRLSEWQYDVNVEDQRLSAALGDEEPVEDAREDFRCRGCAVVACVRNPEHLADVSSTLERSLA